MPECSSGCPGSWIQDGYCDRACNNTECNWDGGDCTHQGVLVNGSPPAYDDYGNIDNTDNEHVDECHQSCSDSWLADGYCDPVSLFLL